MDLENAAAAVRYPIRDHDAKFPALLDEVLADAATAVALTGTRTPQMNTVTERRKRTCRNKPPGRTLTWNHAHLPHTPRESENHDNDHRPHHALRTTPNRTAAPHTRTNHRRSPDHPPRHPKTRPPPPRVRTSCLTNSDE